MYAFDYERQIWVEGKEARALLIQQHQKTLDLLLSDRGQDYAAAVGVDRSEMISRTESALAKLEG